MPSQTTNPIGPVIAGAGPGSHRTGTVQVLSLTTAYPNARDPAAGLFVRSRLQAMAAFHPVTVLAPVALMQYSNPENVWLGARGIPLRRVDEQLTILHPRWIYPPLSGALNGACLFSQLLPRVVLLRREIRFQVIDAQFGHPEAFVAALLAAIFHVPFTVTLRGSEVDHARHFLRRRQLAWALRRAARVFAVSQRLNQFAVSLGAAPERVLTVPNGVDSAIFFERDRMECRRRQGVPPQSKIILSAGHLIELKGHHRAVAGLKQLMDRGIDARLVIAGGTGRVASYESAIRKAIADAQLEERVRLAGQVSPATLAELMCAADVFCLASTREGWPNVVHEAMSCGIPVVATDVGAVPQMIPSPEYGFIVPVNDADALSSALEQALARPWNHSAIAAYAQSRSWAAVGREVAAQLQRAVEEPVRHGAAESFGQPRP